MLRAVSYDISVLFMLNDPSYTSPMRATRTGRIRARENPSHLIFDYLDLIISTSFRPPYSDRYKLFRRSLPLFCLMSRRVSGCISGFLADVIEQSRPVIYLTDFLVYSGERAA